MRVKKWADESKEAMARRHRAIILDLFRSVIKDTPVGTSDPSRNYVGGRLKGNWIISADNPSDGTFDVVDPAGTVTTKKVEDFVADLKAHKNFDIFLTNNMPYAYRIEFEGWSHTKAPEGMVRKNLIRVSNNLRAT